MSFLIFKSRIQNELSPLERERLFALIKKQCRVAIVVITAEEIDNIRREMTMNACVARAHSEVIQKLIPVPRMSMHAM